MAQQTDNMSKSVDDMTHIHIQLVYRDGQRLLSNTVKIKRPATWPKAIMFQDVLYLHSADNSYRSCEVLHVD